MRKKRYKKPASHQRIALERIKELFGHASAVFKSDKSLADRYVFLARKLSMKYKVKLSSKFKKQHCKHCRSFLVPGENCRVRVSNGKLVYYCFKCRKFMRFPYKKR